MKTETDRQCVQQSFHIGFTDSMVPRGRLPEPHKPRGGDRVSDGAVREHSRQERQPIHLAYYALLYYGPPTIAQGLADTPKLISQATCHIVQLPW